jgi:hypothetical protein
MLTIEITINPVLILIQGECGSTFDLLDFFFWFFEAFAIFFSNINTNGIGKSQIKGDAPMFWQVRRLYNHIPGAAFDDRLLAFFPIPSQSIYSSCLTIAAPWLFIQSSRKYVPLL